MDIYRAASYLIKEHGDQAAIFAARWAEYLLDKGDVEGRRKWLRIVEAIEKLSLTGRSDAPLH